MNSTLKEELKKRIKIRDNLIIDLTDITLSLNEEILNYILKRFEKLLLNESTESSTNTNNLIGSIKWNSKSYLNLNLKCKKIMDKLESHLLKINESFTMFATDYVHCLLCYHSYTHTQSHIKTQSIRSTSSFLSRFSNNNLELSNNNNNNNSSDETLDSKWKLLQNEWKLLETFQDKEYKSVLYSNDKKQQLVVAFHVIRTNNDLQMIHKKDLVTQCLFACMHARRALILANEKKYFLSFTGYSLGACLAELCVYLTNNNTKACTFESFATGLEQNVNITTYLNSPNFLNSSSSSIENNYNLYTIIEDSNNNKSNKQFYSSGFKSMSSINGLDLILKELELNNLKKFKQILEWPRIKTTINNNNNNNTKLEDFDFDQAFYSVTFNNAPKEIKYTASSSMNLIQKQVIQTCVDHVFKCYLNMQTNSVQDIEIIDSLNKCIKLTDINLFKHSFKSIKQLNEDCLIKLHLNNSKTYNIVDDEFLIKQINNLKSMYKIEINDNNNNSNAYCYSIVSQKCEINRLRDRLHRLLSIEPKIMEQSSNNLQVNMIKFILRVNKIVIN